MMVWLGAFSDRHPFLGSRLAQLREMQICGVHLGNLGADTHTIFAPRLVEAKGSREQRVEDGELGRRKCRRGDVGEL